MMKKLMIMGLALLIVTSCEDLTDFNKDIKNPEKVPAGALFANATKSLFDFMTTPNVNVNNFRLYAQQWAQTTYADESNYELTERNVNGNGWTTLYATVIRDMKEAKALIAVDQNLSDAARKAQIAMAEVVTIFAYHILVDLFGDVPYSQSLTDDPTPAYDNDADIYTDLFARLNAAIPDLAGDSRMGASDLIYGGDADQWKKFANSLKLRMAIRIADVSAGTAKTMAEAAVASGVMTSNADNFSLAYLGGNPNTNPLWNALVESGRSDYVVCETLVDAMNNLNDPRRDFYFKDTYGGNYVGGVYGDQQAYNVFSHPGAMQETPTHPGIIMGYWEVEFLLADAVERGFTVGGTAESHYNAGIDASIKFWGGDQADVDAYLGQADVAYTTAPGTAMENIAMQKWIALYDQGFEAWTTYRLYDYPPMALAALTDLPTILRYTYPFSEYSINEENVNSAKTAIGGDEQDTKIFWDVK